MQTIRLDPFRNKTFHFWHVFVRGCGPGIFYAFRIDGPRDPAAGHRFNPNKVLIGPYARGICRQLWKRADAVGPAGQPRDVDALRDRGSGRLRLGRRPAAEAADPRVDHLRGARRRLHAVAERRRARIPGTFAGMIEKIPYLQALGVTAVELLPVFEFDDSRRVAQPGGRGASQLLGLQHRRVLQPALRLLRRPQTARRTSTSSAIW